jgi:hypothetical protein
MWFLVLRLLGFGINQAKKHKAKKNQAQQDIHSGWYDSGSSEMQLPSQLTGGDARSTAKSFADLFLRFFQFVLGLTVVGLYGVDLNHAREKHVYADPKWVYAAVTAGLGALTALIHLLALFMLKNRPLATRTRLHLPIFGWECILCILWLTLFGIFGKMYISEDPEGVKGIVRMKHAVWVDLTNLTLWVISATWCGLRWRRGMKAVAAAGDEPMEKFESVG